MVGSEARHSPRYSRQLEVDIDGLEIVTTNVALGGVQLCCPEMRYRGFERAQKGGETNLRIRIPGTRNWLAVTGRSRYANPCEDEYLIGFQFTGFVAGAKTQWSTYIDTLADAKPIA
jgi:hypothetical protein